MIISTIGTNTATIIMTKIKYSTYVHIIHIVVVDNIDVANEDNIRFFAFDTGPAATATATATATADATDVAICYYVLMFLLIMQYFNFYCY